MKRISKMLAVLTIYQCAYAIWGSLIREESVATTTHHNFTPNPAQSFLLHSYASGKYLGIKGEGLTENKFDLMLYDSPESQTTQWKANDTHTRKGRAIFGITLVTGTTNESSEIMARSFVQLSIQENRQPIMIKNESYEKSIHFTMELFPPCCSVNCTVEPSQIRIKVTQIDNSIDGYYLSANRRGRVSFLYDQLEPARCLFAVLFYSKRISQHERYSIGRIRLPQMLLVNYENKTGKYLKGQTQV